jgi:hypothetical protein
MSAAAALANDAIAWKGVDYRALQRGRTARAVRRLRMRGEGAGAGGAEVVGVGDDP